MKNAIIYYSVGALLYCPANNDSIVTSITSEKFGTKYSLALCLEDTIGDDHVEEAEEKMLESLRAIHRESTTSSFYMPKIFIRVRYPEQIKKLCDKLKESLSIITGFIAPKFDLDCADDYINAIKSINSTYDKTLYFMPIFESHAIINLKTRYDVLYSLKEKIDSIEPYILNIRVGGNDLSHAFGLRRHVNESIHDMKPIDSIFSDIITVFGMNYVISGPVWEYYNGLKWSKGLIKEIQQDLLCGFIGKTVIHPKQIDIVNSALQVSEHDYEDAKSILNWNEDSTNLVSGSCSNERMNEYKTHSNWALKTLFLAEYYGISEI